MSIEEVGALTAGSKETEAVYLPGQKMPLIWPLKWREYEARTFWGGKTTVLVTKSFLTNLISALVLK